MLDYYVIRSKCRLKTNFNISFFTMIFGLKKIIKRKNKGACFLLNFYVKNLYLWHFSQVTWVSSFLHWDLHLKAFKSQLNLKGPPMGVRGLFSREGQEPTFCLKTMKKILFFPKKFKNILFLAGLGLGKCPPLPSPADAHGTTLP